jgi:hypothetical protein
MNVRVCGPNLQDLSRGCTFHVHADGCSDLNYYGPDRHRGGDRLGSREYLIEDATTMKVVIDTYGDQIDEQPEDEKERYVSDLVTDFWFAPCCGAMPFGINPYSSEGVVVTTENVINIETFHVNGPCDLVAVNSLKAALVAVETLTKDHDDPLTQIIISANPGWRLIRGELRYSADWL